MRHVKYSSLIYNYFTGHSKCVVTEQASNTAKSCVFPFTYKGQISYGCIAEDEEIEDATYAVAIINGGKKETEEDERGDKDETKTVKFWCPTRRQLSQKDVDRLSNTYTISFKEHIQSKNCHEQLRNDINWTIQDTGLKS